jgi:hypothetical protein
MKTLLASLLLIVGISSALAQKTTVEVDDFTKISFGVPGTLYLTQGDKNSVEIHADEETMDRVEVVQEGNKLKIRNRKSYGWNSWNSSKISVYVTMKTIEGIGVSGSGSVVGKNQIKAGNIDLDISGSGNLEMELNAEDVDISISGSGSVALNGSGGKADVSISGSGKIRAEEFEVSTFIASISGSGTCYITANDEIDARISGSGSVYYRGNPDKVSAHASGSGKVKKL